MLFFNSSSSQRAQPALIRKLNGIWITNNEITQYRAQPSYSKQCELFGKFWGLTLLFFKIKIFIRMKFLKILDCYEKEILKDILKDFWIWKRQFSFRSNGWDLIRPFKTLNKTSQTKKTMISLVRLKFKVWKLTFILLLQEDERLCDHRTLTRSICHLWQISMFFLSHIF